MNSDFTIAVHYLVYLVYLPDHMACSGSIAANVCTNAARIRKIMSCLRNHGFVKTKEGIGGGYILDCNPQEVSLADIYRTVSRGSLKPNWYTGDPEQKCIVSSNTQVVMNQIFNKAKLYLEKYFENITLRSVLEKIKLCP
ncbi:RrF2 family transcriptional regulator [Neobacillus ginsengisoli]|uniref:Rrf2 family protein n=1 Tax=Neobacillus ginsengisoli TaxID=904295 RepID=A0ABT9Y1F0_9BACI|nr:Rrf2 family transcriptional regulator [Neobacillus ginsengisoli]MDQ0201650.1 Rrf2 family protein [Neobacillus ginsengisoli]